MLGYAMDENAEMLPREYVLHSGKTPQIGADGKSQVTLVGNKVKIVVLAQYHDAQISTDEARKVLRIMVVEPILAPLLTNDSGIVIKRNRRIHHWRAESRRPSRETKDCGVCRSPMNGHIAPRRHSGTTDAPTFRGSARHLRRMRPTARGARPTTRAIAAVLKERLMCDYSLMTFPNRLANEGEILVTHKFSTGSIGFVSPTELGAVPPSPQCTNAEFWSKVKAWFAGPPVRSAIPAVCIPPGARLIVQSVPDRVQQLLQAKPGDEVIFTETTATWGQFRDALRIRANQEILLQSLGEGLEVQIISMASSEETPTREVYSYSLVPHRR